SGFEPVDSQRAIDGMYEPDFADAGALVGGQFNDLVVARGIRREDLCDPVRGTAHTARIELLKVANDENVGLHYGVDLFVFLGRLRQADVKRSDIRATGLVFDRIGCLAIDLTDDLLV